ncbi:hypothetical protein GCM10022247_34060 [Allokutzneria multivorans]|uniref:GGDEF domain-containing protein n=1 Tax=Allokutzneria multivorans TaxID=1142134 RepID=A0ABP7SAI8_9PSEU
MSPRKFTLLAASAIAALAVVVLVVVLGWFDPVTTQALDKFTQVLASSVALVGFLVTARRAEGSDRRWRFWMAGAMGSLTVGLVTWTWGLVFMGIGLPASTLAPIGFMMTPVFALFALLTLARGQRPPTTPRPRKPWLRALDTLIVLGAVLVLTLVTAGESVVRIWTSDLAGLLTTVLHPALYLVVIVLVLLLARRNRVSWQLPLLFLGLAFVAQSTSGWIFAYLVANGVDRIPTWADIGFMACPVFYALAPWAPTAPRREPGPDPLRTGDYLHLAVPYLPLLITGMFIGVGTATGVRLGPAEVYVGLAVVALVILRQLITMTDNVALLEEIRQSQKQLQYQAYHDPLTGLANRALFQECLGTALRSSQPLILLFVDVDDFKTVNDRYGHAAGDEVLCAVAGRLRAAVRAEDVVARLGGDEFAVLIMTGDGDPEQVGARVLTVLEAPYGIRGENRMVRASIGLVCFGAMDPDLSPDDLLGRADAAMYAAKRKGKGTLVVHGAASA